MARKDAQETQDANVQARKQADAEQDEQAEANRALPPGGGGVDDVDDAGNRRDASPQAGQANESGPAVEGNMDLNAVKAGITDTSRAEGIAAAEAGNAQVAAQFEREAQIGYRGFNPDPAPFDHYTLRGRALDLPVPETDPGMYAESIGADRQAAARFPSHPDVRDADQGPALEQTMIPPDGKDANVRAQEEGLSDTLAAEANK
jgi:hypothetical protein